MRSQSDDIQSPGPPCHHAGETPFDAVIALFTFGGAIGWIAIVGAARLEMSPAKTAATRASAQSRSALTSKIHADRELDASRRAHRGGICRCPVAPVEGVGHRAAPHHIVRGQAGGIADAQVDTCPCRHCLRVGVVRELFARVEGGGPERQPRQPGGIPLRPKVEQPGRHPRGRLAIQQIGLRSRLYRLEIRSPR